jgi:transcriptional regulator with XRE-family HTH domain
MTLKLREVRKERGLTLLDLASMTHISESDLSQVERGQRPAFPGWQRRISKALRVPAAELFGEAENDTGK